MKDLAGRRALVTGATGGLGRHIVGELARAGVHLAISARNRSALHDLAGQIRGRGPDVLPFPADLTRPDAGEHLATAIEQTLAHSTS